MRSRGQLPTDQARKTNEVVKTGEIANIRTINGFIEVQIEFETDVLSPWMPYCLPFVGGTSIFCFPRIGQGGLIVSEGGENHLNRFLPNLDTSQQFAGLGAQDFKILFENGDFIHHNAGDLTINSTATVVINTKSATLNTETTTVNAKNATVNAETITTKGQKTTVNAPLIKLNGNVTIAGSLSQVPGEDGSIGEAVFTAPARFKEKVKLEQEVTAEKEVTVKGKAISPHTHPTPAGESGVMK